MRIAIDRERCVGSGNCLYWAPGTFDLDDDGVSVVVDPEGDDLRRVRVAAEGCPTRAITLDLDDGPDGARRVAPTRPDTMPDTTMVDTRSTDAHRTD